MLDVVRTKSVLGVGGAQYSTCTIGNYSILQSVQQLSAVRRTNNAHRLHLSVPCLTSKKSQTQPNHSALESPEGQHQRGDHQRWWQLPPDAQGLLPSCSMGCPACMTHAASDETCFHMGFPRVLRAWVWEGGINLSLSQTAGQNTIWMARRAASEM